MRKQIADRLFICALILLDQCTAAFDKTTLRHAVLDTGGASASLLSAMLTIVSLIAIADTLVNDVMPPQFVYRFGLRWRQRLWMVLAAFVATQAFVLARLDLAHFIALTYVVIAARAAAVTFIDLHAQVQASKRGRRATDPEAFHA